MFDDVEQKQVTIPPQYCQQPHSLNLFHLLLEETESP